MIGGNLCETTGRERPFDLRLGYIWRNVSEGYSVRDELVEALRSSLFPHYRSLGDSVRDELEVV